MRTIVDTYKVTYPIEDQIQGEMSVQKIFETTTGPLFHYTSREVFWKIIEDESFLARHILFPMTLKNMRWVKNLFRTV